MTYYESNPQLREYFETLPECIRARLLNAGVEITTLGELKQVTEHLRETEFADSFDHL